MPCWSTNTGTCRPTALAWPATPANRSRTTTGVSAAKRRAAPIDNLEKQRPSAKPGSGRLPSKLAKMASRATPSGAGAHVTAPPEARPRLNMAAPPEALPWPTANSASSEAPPPLDARAASGVPIAALVTAINLDEVCVASGVPIAALATAGSLDEAREVCQPRWAPGLRAFPEKEPADLDPSEEDVDWEESWGIDHASRGR